MANNNTTTNKVKKPIINNEEALRIITLIQQGDSQAENELAELGSVFVKAVAKQYVDKGLSDEELIAASRYGMLRASHSSTSRVASPLQLMPYGGCARPFCRLSARKRTTESERI